MARNNVMTGIGARTGGFVARHPRLVAALLAMIVLLALQDGAVAADGTYTEPTSAGSVDTGPEPTED